MAIQSDGPNHDKNLWYQSIFYPRLVRLSKRGRTSTISDDVNAPTPTLHPPGSETGMSTSVLMLTSTNYRL